MANNVFASLQGTSMTKQFGNRVIRGAWFVLASLALVASAAQAAPKPFEDGDRVCFVGDSITHGGLYHGYVQLFYTTRFPERNIQFFNCGISGDSAGGATNRFPWDIGANRPTVATIMLGMNDVNRGLYGKDNPDQANLKSRQNAIDGHVANMRKLSEQLRDAGCRLIYITPSIYDQTSKMSNENLFGVNDALGICGDHARKLAAEFGGSVVDFHGAMGRINAEYQKADPKGTIVGGDRVHPGPMGHLVMAYTFLKAQGLCPYVSKTVIDAADLKVVESLNCTVEDVSATAGTLSFTSLEKALPFPTPRGAEKALELVPFVQDLNQEVLTVKGLSPGEYELAIDDAPVGKYSAGQLAAGINLAENTNTPQYKQAAKVAAANEKRHSLIAGKLRSFVNTEIYLRNLKTVDLDDFEAVKKALNARVDKLREQKSPYANHYAGQAKLYIAEKGKEAQYKQEVAQALKTMLTENRPVKHRYVVRKAR
jgi:endoglucanase